jgi:hypothetical protein
MNSLSFRMWMTAGLLSSFLEVVTPFVEPLSTQNTPFPSVSPYASGCLRYFCLTFFTASAYDDPYLVALMPDQSLEIRDIETQSVKQVVPAPEPSSEHPNGPRRGFSWNPQGHMVPSTQLKDVLQLVPVPLIR